MMKVGEICGHVLTGRLLQTDSISKKDSNLIIGYIPSQDVSRPLPLRLPKTDLGHRYFEVTETSIAMIPMISMLGVV